MGSSAKLLLPPATSQLSDDLAGRDDDPVEAAIVADRREKLVQALSVLPREQRRAVGLAYYAGYSHAEIAREMHTPIGTVKSRLRIALQRLRLVLNDKVRV